MALAAQLGSVGSPDIGSEATLEMGVVVSPLLLEVEAEQEPRRIHVRVGGEIRRAQRASGCLLDPGEGDEVLLATSTGGRSFVLTVLQARRPRDVRLEGDASIVAEGTLGLVAKGIELLTPGRMGVTADQLELQARQAQGRFEGVTTIARSWLGKLGAGELFAERFDTLFGRLSQRAKRSYRVITESENVRARHIDVSVEETHRTRSKHHIAIAEELVKIDGEQILMG